MEKEKEINNNINKKEDTEKMNSFPGFQGSFDFYEQNEKDNQKNNTSIEEIINDKKKLNDLLSTELMNKMKLISPIPQSNAPKRKMSGVAMMEKEDGNEDDDLDEKDEDNFSSSGNKDNYNDNNIDEDKDDDEDEDSSKLSDNLCYNNKQKNNNSYINNDLKDDKNKNQNNDNKDNKDNKDKKDNKDNYKINNGKINNLNKTFSYNVIKKIRIIII